MEKHSIILGFISTVRHSFIGSVKVYTRGSCYKFYLILKFIFPEAIAYYTISEGHVVTKIGDRFYDIEGEYEHPEIDLIPLSTEPNIEAQAPNWIFDITVYKE